MNSIENKPIRSLLMLCVENVVNNDIEYNEETIDGHSYDLIEMYKENLCNWDTFITACFAKGYIGFIMNIIESGIQVNTENILRQACFKGYLDIVKHYVNKETYINNCLEIAVSYNNVNIVEYLITNNKDRIKYNDNIAVRTAASLGNLEMVKLLCEAWDALHPSAEGALLPQTGANVRDNKDNALLQACANGHLDVVKYLMEEHNAHHVDTLKIACKMGRLFVVKYFIEKHEANVALITQYGKKFNQKNMLRQLNLIS